MLFSLPSDSGSRMSPPLLMSRCRRWWADATTHLRSSSTCNLGMLHLMPRTRGTVYAQFCRLHSTRWSPSRYMTCTPYPVLRSQTASRLQLHHDHSVRLTVYVHACMTRTRQHHSAPAVVSLLHLSGWGAILPLVTEQIRASPERPNFRVRSPRMLVHRGIVLSRYLLPG